MSHTEEENETILDHDLESDEDVFWNSRSQPEEEVETEIPEIGVDNKSHESEFESIWDKTYKNETVRIIPKLNKDHKKLVRLRRDLIMKFILFSVIIGRSVCNCKGNWRDDYTE